jgi:hypothetical protein
MTGDDGFGSFDPDDHVESEIPAPLNLLLEARARAQSLRNVPAADKTVAQISRCPTYVPFGIETLSVEATNGIVEPAGVVLLEAGLSIIRRLPGVAEIRQARKAVLRRADPEMMHWLGDFPPLSPSMAGTGDRQYRLHIPKSLGKQIGTLARSLGMSQSMLNLYALMAGLLMVPTLVRAEYRRAMFEALLELKAVLRRRGDQAHARATTLPARDAVDDGRWTIAGLIGSEGHDAADE